MAKRVQGHQRIILTTTRWSPHEYRRLVLRREKSGARTDAAYLRAAALTGIEFQMPAFETQRDLRNAILQLAGVLQALPPGRLRDETVAEAKAALRRLCK